MNITDIDDKIIQRARQQHLLNKLRHQSTDLNSNLLSQLDQSFETFFKKTIGSLIPDLSYRELTSKLSVEPKWRVEMLTREEKFGMWLDALVYLLILLACFVFRDFDFCFGKKKQK